MIQQVEFLTVQEVAEYLRVTSMTVYREVKRGQLPALRVGRQYRFRKTDVEKYLQSNMEGIGAAE